MRVLLFDDDPQLLLALRTALGRYGMDVNPAATVDYAVQLLGALEFDVTLLDWNDGEALKALELLAELQPDCLRFVLSETSQADSGYDGELVNAWLSKPVDVDALAHLMRDQRVTRRRLW